LEQAVEQAMSMPFLPIYSQRLAALSEAYVLAGRMDKAVQLAQQALERARGIRNQVTRRAPFGYSARSRHGVIPQRSNRPKITTGRQWP
jgi:hypothetical protein